MALKKLWESLQTEEGKLKRSLKQTRRNADKFLNDQLTTIENLEEELYNARVSAQNTNTFEQIAKVKLKLKAEQMKLQKYIEIYEEEFEGKPKLAVYDDYDEDDINEEDTDKA